MRAYEVLLEGRSKAITEDAAIRLLETTHSHCADKQPIYRGILADEPWLYAKPSAKLRRARNTTNYVNLCVSNFASWQTFPNRSKSFICSTSIETAENYGDAYQVFPINGSKIGVCEVDDFWISFDSLSGVGLDIETLNFHLLSNITKNSTNFTNFIRSADLFGEKLRKDPSQVNGSVADLLGPFLEGSMRFSEFLEQILDPRANGFQLQTTSNFDCGTDNEVWMEGPVLLKRVEE